MSDNENKMVGTLSETLQYDEKGRPERAQITSVHPTSENSDGASDGFENAYFPNTIFDRIGDMYLIQTFGDSMQDAKIDNSDYLIVDPEREPKHRDIVVASINGSQTVKRLIIREEYITLAPESPDYDYMRLKHIDELDIFGVVVWVLKKIT